MKLKLCILFTLIFMITLLYVPFLRGVPYVNRETLYERLRPYAVREDMVLKDESDLISAIRVKAGDYQEALYFGPSSYINVEECIVIYAPQREEQILNKLKDHIERQKTAFNGYGATQSELLKQAKVEKIGSYAVCVVSSDPQLIQKVRKELR